MDAAALTQSKNGVKLEVNVNPNSNEFRIQKVNPWTDRLEIKLESPPEDGKANKELLNKLEEILGKPVKILRGGKSRKKTLKIKDITVREVGEQL